MRPLSLVTLIVNIQNIDYIFFFLKYKLVKVQKAIFSKYLERNSRTESLKYGYLLMVIIIIFFINNYTNIV